MLLCSPRYHSLHKKNSQMSGLYPIRQQESICMVTSILHTSNEPSHVATTLVSQFSASLLAVFHSIKRNFTSSIKVCATFKQSVPGFCHCPSLAPTCTLRSWVPFLAPPGDLPLYRCYSTGAISLLHDHIAFPTKKKKKKSCINTLTSQFTQWFKWPHVRLKVA